MVLARPIFSPIDFIQVKGRGTRLFTFKYEDGSRQQTKAKDRFHLFDFFANCEYFEEEFNYDEKLTLPKGESIEGEVDDGGGIKPADYTNTSPDPLATIVRDEIGDSGMKIDREMYRERFAEQAIKAADTNEDLRTAVEAEDWTAVENLVRRLLFDKPEEFWNLPKLRQVFATDRSPSLREILLHVFGLTPSIPTRSQLAREAFERFAASQPINATHSRELQGVFYSYLLNPSIRFLINEGRFAELRASDAGLYRAIAALSPNERKSLIQYIQAEVPLSEFEKVA